MPEVVMVADPREPGAPIGKDEIDPELVRLRRPPPKIGTVTAAAVVVGCVFFMVRLKDDFAFARAGDSPRPVSPADVVAGKVADESYVTVPAPLERSAAVRARVTEANAGTRVVPVAGTSDRLWVAVPGDAWGPYQHDEIVTGRLRSLDDVRVADAVGAYVKAHPSPRFVAGAELRRARTSGAAQLTLVDGGTVAVAAGDPIEIAIPDPARSVVTATFTERLPDAGAWTTALAAAGLVPAGAAPVATGDGTARWEVAGARDEVASKLEQASLWSARVEPATARTRTAWSSLVATDAGLEAEGRVIPWDAIDVAAVWAPRSIPAGAKVVLVDEKPGTYWYLPPLYVGLGLFAVLFTWALVLAVRRQFLDQPKVTAKP